jgi:uncharacterized protein YndB with AHSA1/START domain
MTGAGPAGVAEGAAMSLEHILERTVTIRAQRPTVSRFFTDVERFATWWGAGSRIDPHPGGEVYIRYPNGVVAAGVCVQVNEPDRYSFSYGYESGRPVSPGASLVTVRLEEVDGGTSLHLRHAFASSDARDQHVQGWRYQLAVLANLAAAEQHRGVEAVVDRFLAAWNEVDRNARRRELEAVALPELEFRDAYSVTASIVDLVEHIGAVQLHMPGVRLDRRGPVRHCQGTAIADWVALAADGVERGRGCNVFELAPNGRISRAVGFRS